MPTVISAVSSQTLPARAVYARPCRTVLIIVFCLGLAGCSLDFLKEKLQAATGEDKAAIALAADRLTELDQAMYSYSDRFVTLIADATDRAVKEHPTKEAKKEALRLKLHNSSSVYSIASGSNPLGKLLDLATVATLNKIQMVDESRAKQIFGDSHQTIENAFHAVHDYIWGVQDASLNRRKLPVCNG